MKPVTVTMHGICLTLSTSAAGHAYLEGVTPQQRQAVLLEALGRLAALGGRPAVP